MYRTSLSPRDIQVYRLCESLTEGLIYFMVVFGPWAFGTTQPWSIWTMNACGYVLGLLLAAKLIVRRKGYLPPRWDSLPEVPPGIRGLTRLVAILTCLVLAFCLISALNARATFIRHEWRFEYHDRCIKWLPFSLDSIRSWAAFWNYLGLAGSFWAIVDWLPGKTLNEERAERRVAAPGGESGSPAPLLPARLRHLLWVLAINGGVLALEGILQRVEGSGRLLFLVKPSVNPDAGSQFGPYAYRGNACSYFNLVWPVCLGFWWTLHRGSGLRRYGHHLVLASSALMAACPIISTSRGGALVTAGILLFGLLSLAVTHFLFGRSRHEQPRQTLVNCVLVLVFSITTLVLGYYFGWKALKPRMVQLAGDSQIRTAMYEAARPMAADYPLFGTGPGTFESVFQLYRYSTETYWPAQLHNDWLETRITFGWVGSALIAATFVTVLLRWFLPGGIHGGRRFMILVWLALAGCMVHARWDFPFQKYSILFLFLLLCAILLNLSRRPS